MIRYILKLQLFQIDKKYPMININTKRICISQSNDVFIIFRSNKYCDMTLKTCDNEQIQTHKVVLASHSEVFASLFDQNSEGNLKEISINYGSDIIRTVLSWMYNPISEIVVNKSNFSVNDLSK